jgi:parvulin-like peptidyl-prolyl isomerase
LPPDYDALPEDEVAKLFGQGFARQLDELPTDHWVGPVQSGYGLHLVLLRKRTGGELPELEGVRDAVRREWLASHRKETAEAFYRRLRQRYAVAVEPHAQAAAEVSALEVTR